MEKVPIIDVTKENFAQLWPSLTFSIKNASFIALDLELSGIGNRKEINAKSIEDRYKAMTTVANTRAILSIGLSCFTLREKEERDHNVIKFMVQTFNLLVLCSENYTVEPDSLSFLVNHGFDFNRQYTAGLHYYRGNDKKEKNTQGPSIRNFFAEIVKAENPIVLHNGFVDLIFLYQNLYAELPTLFSTFLADLSEIFSGGIYDTKFFSEFKARIPASYLEYVFRKQQRINLANQKSGKTFIYLQFPNYPKTIDVEYRNCSPRVSSRIVESSTVCQNYASHGWCSKGRDCPLSHDIDAVLDVEFSKQNKKRRKKGNSTNAMEQDTLKDAESTMESEMEGVANTDQQPPGGHRAGYDAFMTGFAFATFWLQFGDSSDKVQINEEKNKIYLCGKDQPLLVMRSQFSKISLDHNEKCCRLRIK